MVLLAALAALASVPVTPMAFELQPPDGPGWSRRAKQAARIANDTLKARSRLTLRSSRSLGAPKVGVRGCRKQPSLGCWVRLLKDARGDPFERQPAPLVEGFLLVRLLPLSSADRALVLIWLVDLSKARTALADVAPDELESWLLKHATDRRRLEVDWNRGSLALAFERLWDDHAPSLRQRGYWWPNGSVRLQTELMPPFRFTIDDQRVRTATSAVVLVDRIAVGTRRIELQAGRARIRRKVTVQMGQQTVLHVDAPVDREPTDDRPALLWTGLGVTALGAGLTVAGIAVPVKTRIVQLCGDGVPCNSSRRFARASDYFSARSNPDGGSGPLVVPLGYSLILTGGAWALSAWLSDDPDVPWWWVVAGGLAGGAAYAISEAVH